MNNVKYTNHFVHDIATIVLSILIAIILVKTGILVNILTATVKLGFFGSFFAGLFFTSIFTVAPAIATLGGIAHATSVLSTAFFGALGAVIGDFVIFKFFRDKFSEHLMELIEHQGAWKRIQALLKLKYLRWITFFIGGLIIASPLPDELGIGLMGFLKTKTIWFIAFSFVCNFVGILLIGFAAKTL